MAEQYRPSELGETLDLIGGYTGKLIGSFLLTQREWIDDEHLRAITSATIDQVEYDSKYLFPKPTIIQNWVYSAKLRDVFGDFLTDFCVNGVFRLPPGRGYVQPIFDGQWITDFQLKSYRELESMNQNK
jgi:hypothetical protein